MNKWLFRLVWVPALVIAVLFLVANRTLVPISLDPFRPDNPALSTPALPLWFWLMAMLFVGVAAGAAGMWMSARPRRQKARADRRELKALRKELAVTQAKLRAAEAVRREAAPPLLESNDA